jgi:hypothetical protein
MSLIAVVIILAANLGLGTAIFGGEGASRNADMLGTERSSWRSTGSVPLNPIQLALALEPRDGRDEWRPANPGSYTDGDPSYTLRIWSAMLILGGATSLASAFLWRRSVRLSRDKGHLDLTYLLIGLSTLQLLGFAVSLMLIQELDKLASVPYYLTGIERLDRGGQIELVQRLVTAYDALLYLGGGVLLVVACFTLATHTWYSVGDSLVAKISGAVLAVSVIYYLGFFEYAFSWLFFVGGIATLILLVHAGWQAYRGTEFISNQPGLGDSAES